MSNPEFRFERDYKQRKENIEFEEEETEDNLED